MGQFLRDEYIRNLNVDEASLARINDVFVQRGLSWNEGRDEGTPQRVVLFYIIRFDGKGYRLTNFQEVLKYYAEATKVERIVFTLDSIENRKSGGFSGTNMELRLDLDPNNSTLKVTADDHAWVDASYAALAEIFRRLRNASRFVRTPWTGLVVQIIGLLVGLVLSLWAAVKVSPHLTVANAFVVTLLFAFLIYSNVWTYVLGQIGRAIEYGFPNVGFKRKGKGGFHWLVQALIAAVLGAVVLFLLNKAFTFAGAVLGSFVSG